MRPKRGAFAPPHMLFMRLESTKTELRHDHEMVRSKAAWILEMTELDVPLILSKDTIAMRSDHCFLSALLPSVSTTFMN